MPECGTQCWLCDLPIRFDTYKGCSHDCTYCFVRKKTSLDVSFAETDVALRRFIKGERSLTTGWCDWNIPIHFGGMSDPFQPCEIEYGRTLNAMKVFAETGYPVVISTKGKLCVEEPYFSLLRKMNVVMQISAVCSKFDKLEPGAPKFEERLGIIGRLSGNVKRVIVRAQPYIHDVFEDVMDNIPRFKEAGAYGIIFEGMKFARKKPGLVKIGGDYVQKKTILEKDFERIRTRCHENGLKFYAGENRLRAMGDSLTCCGIDGLEGFRPNVFNLNHKVNGDDTKATERMKENGTAMCFQSTTQTAAGSRFWRKHSFEYGMQYFASEKKELVKEVLIGEK